MHPVLFKIAPLTIYSLGLFWALGAFVAAWIVRLECIAPSSIRAERFSAFIWF